MARGGARTGAAATAQAPDEVDGVQVNFCREPVCDNFGRPPIGAARLGRGVSNQYTRFGRAKKAPALKCNTCSSLAPIKSNAGIVEELARMQAYQRPAPGPGCRTAGCRHEGLPAALYPQLYQRHGRTKAGTPRYECKACGKTVSAGKTTRKPKRGDLDIDLFRLLANKVPLRRILRVKNINARTLYRKIDIIHRKCLAFVADRERRLPDMRFERLYLATDRQSYVVNWSSREDRTNSQLTGMATADNHSGYVFAAHLDFDPSLDYAAVEADAKAIGDLDKNVPERKYARLWFQADVKTARRANPVGRGKSVQGLKKTVAALYQEALARDDIEAPGLEQDRKLPDYGMKVRAEYVMFAHFEFLRRMLRGCRKFRFYLDPDSGIRAACLATFHREIRADRAEAFYVLIAKTMKRTERERLISQAWSEFERRLSEVAGRIQGGERLEELDVEQIARDWETDLPELKEDELIEVFKRRQGMTKRQKRQMKDPEAMKVEAFVQRLMIRASIPKMQPVGPFGDKWLAHPMPRLNEPAKLICHLTDRGVPPQDNVAGTGWRISMTAPACTRSITSSRSPAAASTCSIAATTRRRPIASTSSTCRLIRRW